jgi:hypothetical protein
MIVRQGNFVFAVSLLGTGLLAAGGAAAQEVKNVDKGIEILYTASILSAAAPFAESEEKCADATPGFTIVPESVKAVVADSMLTDPGGNMDEKPIKAEGRTRLLNNNTRICLKSHCEAGVVYQCMMNVNASWQERK